MAQSARNPRFPQRRSAVHLYKILILFHCPLDGERFTFGAIPAFLRFAQISVDILHAMHPGLLGKKADILLHPKHIFHIRRYADAAVKPYRQTGEGGKVWEDRGDVLLCVRPCIKRLSESEKGRLLSHPGLCPVGVIRRWMACLGRMDFIQPKIDRIRKIRNALWKRKNAGRKGGEVTHPIGSKQSKCSCDKQMEANLLRQSKWKQMLLLTSK